MPIFCWSLLGNLENVSNLLPMNLPMVGIHSRLVWVYIAHIYATWARARVFDINMNLGILHIISKSIYLQLIYMKLPMHYLTP